MSNKSALVIGGNLAGVRAALDLAQSGIQVYWVEGSPFLGYGSEGQVSPHLLTAEMLEAAKHPSVKVLTDARVTGLTGQRGDFQVEVQHGPRYVDLARCTACGDCDPVCPVTVSVTGPEPGRRNGRSRKAIFGQGYGAVPNVFAIEKRGIAPCKATCPGGIHVQGYVALIAQGRFQEALDLIYEAVPFPGILGRVCPHPCEEKCRRGTEVDEPVAICALKRFVADWGWEKDLSGSQIAPAGPSLRSGWEFVIQRSSGGLQIRREQTNSTPSQRVAIVGAGPAGLTAAYFLARQGVAGEIFEALPVAGGMMAVGIPRYRLPTEVLRREIATIEALGVKIHLNHPVDGHELQRLREEYDAVFVAVGAHQSWALDIPGEDLKGVFSGVAFLRAVNLAALKIETAPPPRLGKKVVVVGGGDVAIDTARVARRTGGQEITILYRRSYAEMPAESWQVQEAEEEGIRFHFLAAPLRALGRDGVLTALECIRMELGEPDTSGRRRPVPIPGSEFTLECDTLLAAIGQTVDAPFEDLSLARGGTYVADPVTLQTNVPGVFAGGDAVSGPATVIEAVAAGRRAAESILRYLRGEALTLGRTAERSDISAIEYYMPEQPVQRPRARMTCLSLGQRSNFAEVELGFTQEQAVAEAERCLSCGVCSECLACVSVCQPGAIDHSAVEEHLILDIGAVIVADGHGPLAGDVNMDGVYTVEAADEIGASVAAARAMADLASFRQRAPVPGEIVPPTISVNLSSEPPPRGGPRLRPEAQPEGTGFRVSSLQECLPTAAPRLGVFICRCGDKIGSVVDVEALVDSAKGLPGAIYAQDLSFSCQPEGAEVIQRAVTDHRLNRVVLAACSCCSLDQVCYSCTTQRIRCKTNLGVLAADSARLRESTAGTLYPRESMVGTLCPTAMPPQFEFVNIREHCAWFHSDDSVAATAEAERLIAAAVANVNLSSPAARPIIHLGNRVLVAGDGAAAAVCADALIAQGFAVTRSERVPSNVVGSPGRFMATWGGNGHRRQAEADAVVLAPSDAEQLSGLRDTVGIDDSPISLTARLTGVFVCPPDGQTEVGAAVAARVAALLGSGQFVAESNVARVDPQRCRACGTCVSLCEFHAPRLVMSEAVRLVSRIDPALCRGCGTCAAHCPSSAIAAGCSTDEQIEAMLAALLA